MYISEITMQIRLINRKSARPTVNNNRYEKMIDRADIAMYRAKKNGKDQFVCYEIKK